MTKSTTYPMGFLLNRTAQEIRERTARALEPFDLTPRVFGLLARVATDGPLSQIELGRIQKIDRTTIVAIVDALESRGLIRRTADPDDRRKNALILTQAGRRLVTNADQAVRGVERSFLAGLDPDDAQQLRETLTALLRISIPDCEEPAYPTPVLD